MLLLQLVCGHFVDIIQAVLTDIQNSVFFAARPFLEEVAFARFQVPILNNVVIFPNVLRHEFLPSCPGSMGLDSCFSISWSLLPATCCSLEWNFMYAILLGCST